MKPKSSPRHVLTIINPAAGQEQPVLHTLNRVFADTGVDWQIAITKGQGDAAEAAAQAAEAGIDVVAVYGGDGTVMEAANALHTTSIPMAILPGGTANVLAAELDIPNDLEQAARLITDPSARVHPIDMGRVNDQLFFHLSAGILGNIASRTDRAAKNQNGLLAYILSGVEELQKLPSPFRFTLSLDEEDVEIEGVGCMVTNFGKIGIANLRLAHDIDLSDGFMDVMVIRDISLATLAKALKGAIASGEIVDAFWHRRAKNVSFSVPPDMQMMLDGEPFESDTETLTAQVVPGAVEVIVPQDVGNRRVDP